MNMSMSVGRASFDISWSLLTYVLLLNQSRGETSISYVGIPRIWSVRNTCYVYQDHSLSDYSRKKNKNCDGNCDSSDRECSEYMLCLPSLFSKSFLGLFPYV